MKDKQGAILDVVGVGIGAFNLSLAALLQKSKATYKFFEQKKEFGWHTGMLLENAKLQVHFLKDLASCVDPSNPYTFLSYLVDKGRIYQFLNRKQSTISRHEFNHYLKWTAEHIPELHFGETVLDVRYRKGMFNVVTEHGNVNSRHIVIGTGVTPYIPDRFKTFLGKNFFHNHQFKQYLEAETFANKKIAIIGGGQSGAEVFDTIISSQDRPEQVIWVSKRLNFQAMEDSCFANEFYTPRYVKYFYQLPKSIRTKKLDEQRLTSDGITQDFADEIYNKLYELKYIHSIHTKFELAPNHVLTQVRKNNHGYVITLFDQDLEKNIDYEVDVVILATGYRSNVPECLHRLIPEYCNFDMLPVNPDYSLNWLHGETNKIFIQNGARHTHGVADPNLSLAAWRNTIIINSLLNKPVYKTDVVQPIMGRMGLEIMKNISAISPLEENELVSAIV